MQDVLALKEDGSLWVTDKPENLKGWRWDATNSAPLEPPNLVRYDDKTDWKSVHGAWTTALAIKQDGSLWRIGTNRSSGKKAWPGLRTFEPQRLGDDSDWADVFRAAFSTAFQKTDGRIYINAQSSLRKKEILNLDDDMRLERAPYLEGRKWGDVIWTAHPRLGMVQVGVSSDGALRVVDDYHLHAKSVEVVQQDFQVGKETNWVAVIESAYSFVALKADGTLWRWELGDDAGNPARGAKAGRIGTKSDWVGITPSSGGMVALSADGGLWYWKFDARYNHVSDGFQPLLRPSRKPQLVGNVLTKSD
jgi:alpha-tubulin suppressor-like RCC1 family protein